jgi:hypothetical protein
LRKNACRTRHQLAALHGKAYFSSRYLLLCGNAIPRRPLDLKLLNWKTNSTGSSSASTRSSLSGTARLSTAAEFRYRGGSTRPQRACESDCDDCGERAYLRVDSREQHNMVEERQRRFGHG